MIINPGAMTLADWRAIYEGASATLNAEAWKAIDASAAAVARIVAKGDPVYGINTGFGKLASVRIASDDLATLQRNIVLSHAAGTGAPSPVPVVRLMMALKLASFGVGASGVRRETVAMLETMLAKGLTPVIPSQGSVGASGDLAPLSHMAAAMIGVGAIEVGGQTLPAAEALALAGLAPVELGPKEGLALLNGTQFSAANALAGLFRAETVFQSALITGALSTEAAKGSDAPFDPRIHALRGHAGQRAVGDALRDMMAGSATLSVEANGVSDNPLIFADTDEALSGGNFHAEPVAFAADMIAMAICEIGSIAERRIAMLVDPALSGLPAFLTPRPGLNSGFMIAQVTAAALVSENKQRAYPASVDSIPTSANQEDHVSMAAHGARRLLEMADNVSAVIGIEYLAACQGIDFHAPLTSSDALEAAHKHLRAAVPTLEDDRHFHPDMEAATALIRSGSLVAAVPADLPGLS